MILYVSLLIALSEGFYPWYILRANWKLNTKVVVAVVRSSPLGTKVFVTYIVHNPTIFAF